MNTSFSEMTISGTQLNYFFYCKRQLWLSVRGIKMEQTSPLVADGRLLHKARYQRRKKSGKELFLGPIRVDHFDIETNTIHETKRSKKPQEGHLWQLRYYLYVFEQAGFEGVKGVMEYPNANKKVDVELNAQNRTALESILMEVRAVILSENCPPRAQPKQCLYCSFRNFCDAGQA